MVYKEKAVSLYRNKTAFIYVTPLDKIIFFVWYILFWTNINSIYNFDSLWSGGGDKEKKGYLIENKERK